MATHQPRRRWLAVSDISPTVAEACCYKFDQPRTHRCRVPSHAFLLIESGQVDARTPEGRFHGQAGSLFYFHPAAWTEYAVSAGTLLYQANLRFAPPPQQQLTPSLAEFGPLPVHVPLGQAFGEMRQVFETFCLEVPRPGTVPVLRLRAAVHQLLAILASVLTHDRHHWRRLDQWERLRVRLDTELRTSLSASDLARGMNLSRFYFNRAFKQRYGVAPKTYHTQARLREAARRLRSTDQSVKEIAAELGFSNAAVFTRLFKSQLGVLPSELQAGSVRVPELAPSDSRRLFPMNKHLVPPPQTEQDWIRRCYPPSPPTVLERAVRHAAARKRTG